MQALQSAFTGRPFAAPKAAAVRSSSARQSFVVRAAVQAAPEALPVLKLDGSSAGEAQIALRTAGDETANGLVHRYLVYVRQNARQGSTSTLTRSEVRGGGRKPYKQKGSGNARRGSKRSPLMPGGGISFGPKPRDWTISMNKKERKLALATALQSAAADMVVCEDFGALQGVSTKGLVASLASMGIEQGEKVLLVVNEPNEALYLSGRNIPTVAINTAHALQVYDVLNADRIVVEQAALAYINDWFGGGEQ